MNQKEICENQTDAAESKEDLIQTQTKCTEISLDKVDNNDEDETFENSFNSIIIEDEKNYFKTLSCEKNESTMFPCSNCSKVFKSKYGLNEHSKIHFDSQKLKCEICHKQFTRYCIYFQQTLLNYTA